MKIKRKEQGPFLMKQFRISLLGVLLINPVWASDVVVSIKEMTKSDVVELREIPGRTKAEYYRNIHISYHDKKTHQFIATYGKPIEVKYSKQLKCNNDYYPAVMVELNSSHEKVSLLTTFITNTLYIFDQSLKLIKSAESTYRSEEDDSGFYIDKKHIFTLDNVEKFACDRIKELK